MQDETIEYIDKSVEVFHFIPISVLQLQ